MTFTLKIYAKELESHVTYNNPLKEINQNYGSNTIGDLAFFVKSLPREVKELKKKDRKALKKTLQLTYLTCVSLLALTNPTFAATTTVATGLMQPTEIMEIIQWMIKICAMLGIGFAILCLQIASVMRIFRKRKEAIEWSNDIIKGAVQLVLAPILIMLIAYTAYLLFGSSEWFVKPY
jgi:hypothetical protein